MPVAASIPRAQRLIHGNVYCGILYVVAPSAVVAQNEVVVDGPTYVKLPDALGNSGVYLLNASGYCVASFLSNGVFTARGYLLADAVTPIAATAPCYKFKDASGDCVISIDNSGNIKAPHQVLGNVSLSVEYTGGLDDFPVWRSDNCRISFPVVSFRGRGSLPILQILNSSEDCVAKVYQSGQIEVAGYTHFGVGDITYTTVYGGVK